MSRRQRGGVFYQHAGGGEEHSDETDPSLASPAGNGRDPIRLCPALSFVFEDTSYGF